MTDIKEKRHRLRLILAQAYRQKQAGPPRPDPAWRKRLMSRLPGLNGLAGRLDQWAIMERLVWRLVPAAGALTLALAILVGTVGPDPAGEVARLLSADAAAPDLYTFYQSELRNE